MVLLNKNMYPFSLGEEGLTQVAQNLAGLAVGWAKEKQDNPSTDIYVPGPEAIQAIIDSDGWSALNGGLQAVTVDGVTSRWSEVRQAYGSGIIPSFASRLTNEATEYEAYFSFPLGGWQIDVNGSPQSVHVQINAEQEIAEGLLDLVVGVVSDFPATGYQNHVRPPFRVFIGHGGDNQWQVVKRILEDTHGFEVEVFESEERAGHSTLDTVDLMIRSSTAAVVIMSGVDSMLDGTLRARENVVHEIGFCQGVLGKINTLILLEDGVSEFSNIAGMTQIRYAKGDILAAENKIVAALNLRRTAYEAGSGYYVHGYNQGI